jgi:hypothetical protein
MAFTYDVSTSLGQLRLAIGDTVAGAGPRPDGTNYSDAELGVYLTPVIASGYAYGRAVPSMFRVLASEWSNRASVTIGEFSMSSAAVAEAYRKQAAAWEATIDTGGAPVSGGITVGTMTLANRVYTFNETGTVT